MEGTTHDSVLAWQLPSITPPRVRFWRDLITHVGPSTFIDTTILAPTNWPISANLLVSVRARLSRRRHDPESLAWLQAILEAWPGDRHDIPTSTTGLRTLFGQMTRRAVRDAKTSASRSMASARKATTAHDNQSGVGAETPSTDTLGPRKLHLGVGVSGSLIFAGGSDERRATLGVPDLRTFEAVAVAIGISPNDLASLCYHRPVSNEDHYTRFAIPKRSGALRVIAAPKARLRVAQEWLLAQVILPVEAIRVHDAAYGFRVGRSVVDNARRHAGHFVVIRVDFHDFFGTVTFPRVRGLFQTWGYNPGVATTFALLATAIPRTPININGTLRFVGNGIRHLPQGACTSPALTNILCASLDSRLTGYTSRLGFTYTRYADDLVVSHPEAEANVGAVLAGIRRIATAEGFVVEERKTSVMRPSDRQVATGMVLNRIAGSSPGEAVPVRPSRRDLRRLRATLHQCQRDGVEAVSERIGRQADEYAEGYLAYLQMSNPGRAARLRERYLGATLPSTNGPQ